MRVEGRSVLVGAVLLFGGFALYDYLQEKKIEEKKVQESRLMTVDFDQIDQVEIVNSSGTLLLKRSVDGWKLEKPLEDLADNDEVESLIKATATEKILELAKTGPDIDWKVFGLDQPRGKITFSTTAGASNTFEISEKKNFEDNVFARRDGEDRVIVLNWGWERKIAKTVQDFRDRRFLRAKIASVDELDLNNKRAQLKLKREDGKWHLVGDKAELDQNKVREILQSIADAKGSEYVEPKSLPKLKNLFSLRLQLGDKKWKAEVGQSNDLGIYAAISDPSVQMKMESGALDKLINLTAKDLMPDPVEEKKDDLPVSTEETSVSEQKVKN